MEYHSVPNRGVFRLRVKQAFKKAKEICDEWNSDRYLVMLASDRLTLAEINEVNAYLKDGDQQDAFAV